jgi:PAS domain S-box-containing protein
MHFINQLIDVPSTDPDDARRRKLLNIILIGVALLSIVAIFVIVGADITNLYPQERITVLYMGSFGLLAVVVITYVINRYWLSWVASALFLAFFTVVSSLSDEAQEVVQGRTLIMFAIPIMMASVLLRPYASFVAAGLASLLIIVTGFRAGIDPSPFAMIMFFIIALVSWLAANGLERALRDLRTLNLELDQRVQERTRELAESLSKTEAILESTADGIIVFGNDGKATVANPAVTGLLARSLHRITGHNIEQLMEGQVGNEDKETIVNLLKDQEVAHSGIKFQWGKKTLSASMAPVCLDLNEKIGTVAVFRDFTKEAEIDRMKSTFVSLASHELRTPLNAILGYSEMLKEGVYGQLSDRQRDATGRILANTQHMLSLANNLLDRAQIEAGTLKLAIVEFSPAKLIGDAVGAMEVLARNEGLELTGEIEDVPTAVTGDRQRVNQVIVNLIGNALKFTQEGGVHVRAYRHDEGHWAAAVSDTGIGISEEAQEYIFEPFRQADDSVTREHGGAGLGLSIVKQLVEMMGGRIELESEVDKGSTFTTIFPLMPPEAEAGEDV